MQVSILRSCSNKKGIIIKEIGFANCEAYFCIYVSIMYIISLPLRVLPLAKRESFLSFYSSSLSKKRMGSACGGGDRISKCHLKYSNNIGVDPNIICHAEQSEASLFCAFSRPIDFSPCGRRPLVRYAHREHGSVEIYCGLAFAYYCILRQSSTFIVHLYFLQVFLSCPLVAPKDQKARHAESPVGLFFV